MGRPEDVRSSSPGGDEPSVAGPALLLDLRQVSVETHGVGVDWTIVRQWAMASRDEELLHLAAAGLDEVSRVGAWIKTRIKEAAPQIVASAG